MKTSHCLALLVVLCMICHHAGAFGATFSYEQGVFGKTTLSYRKAVIGEGNGLPALVLYLHGGTSRGSDNEAQLLEPGVDSVANYLESHNIHAVFIVPQCPSGGGWLGVMQSALKAMIDYEATQCNVNRDQIYLFGGSMGGTGSWNFLNSYPTLFTAAMPVAGNPSGLSASNVAQTPVYTVMGTNDRIMDLNTVKDFVDSLKVYGADVRFDIEQGWTHENTCIMSYTTERLNWIFGHQSKNKQTGIQNTQVSATRSTAVYNLQGQRVADGLDHLPSGIYISGGRKFMVSQ
jgi:poly(3-hydroxybutyrate) depolymerase